MKNFNQTIQVEIEVDVIAKQLRSMFKDDSAHADIVVEQIIGRSMAHDTIMIGKIMSAMNGFKKEVIVEAGKSYPIKPIRAYGYWTPESIEQKNSVYGDVTRVLVLEVNEYKDNEVLIQYETPKIDGTMSLSQKWVSASEFTI